MNPPEPTSVPRAADHRRVKISPTDWLVIWSTLGLTIALDRLSYPGWWLPAVVVIHFFLFCNVFKVPRKLELLWAVVFLINTGVWLALGRFDWRPVVLTQTPFTLAAIGLTLMWRRKRAGVVAADSPDRRG